MTSYFGAPWSRGLKATTGVLLLICALVALSAGPVGASIIVGVVLLAAAFAVRGYSVSDGQLLIHHLGWATRIDLSHLVRAEFRPNAIDGSLRLGAIGGVFSSVGLFSSRELGFYRGYITDSSRAVVMNFGENRVVVTPDRPEEFVAEVTLHRGYKG